MTRALLVLLLCLGLAAFSVHAPALASPAADAPEVSLDCHGTPAATADAAPDRSTNLPPCCPEGCDGACLAPVTAASVVADAPPAGWEPVTRAGYTVPAHPSSSPDGPTDPPRIRV